MNNLDEWMLEPVPFCETCQLVMGNLKFKKDGKKKIDEMTASDKIVHVLNEMGTEVIEDVDEKKAG